MTPSPGTVKVPLSIPCKKLQPSLRDRATTTKRTGPGGSGPVNADVVITVITTGACTGVTATVGPSGAPAGPFALVQGPIGTWKHTLPRAAFPGGWTAGTKTVTITGPSPAPPAPTFQFVVT